MPSDDLQYLLDVAREAGQLALSYFGQVTGEQKGDGTLFCRGDTETEQLIRARLSVRWPDDAVVGEELAGAEDIGEGRAWIIDPIDGTLNYLYGAGEWCISIGLSDGGRPVMGAIYAPATERMWYAEAGGGAFRNGEQIQATKQAELSNNALFGCDSVAIDRIGLGVAPRKRNIGSAALHACYVAQGTFCGTLYAVWGLWDVAAGMCICEEAGAPAWRLDSSRLEGLGEFRATQKVKGIVVICPAQLRDAILEGIAPGAG